MTPESIRNLRRTISDTKTALYRLERVLQELEETARDAPYVHVKPEDLRDRSASLDLTQLIDFLENFPRISES